MFDSFVINILCDVLCCCGLCDRAAHIRRLGIKLSFCDVLSIFHTYFRSVININVLLIVIDMIMLPLQRWQCHCIHCIIKTVTRLKLKC